MILIKNSSVKKKLKPNRVEYHQVFHKKISQEKEMEKENPYS